MDEVEFALRYPFTSEAKRAIEGISLSERIVELGLERVRKALKGQSSSRMLFHESDKKEDIASFAAARMIIGHLRNSFITNRFAVNESKIARGRLDKDTEAAVDIVAARFGIKARKEGNSFLIDLPAYVSFCPRSPHYKLINRKINRGIVEITPEERKRLLEEAIRKHIEDVPVVKDPPDAIKKAGEKLVEELPKSQGTIKVEPGDYPPCIERMLESAKKHENLPHHARWFLATYLLAISMPDDAIVAIYSNMPDFSEKVTRYQIEHAKRKGYSVPSCATVTTYGLCCAVCRVGTPLRWHELPKEKKEATKR